MLIEGVLFVILTLTNIGSMKTELLAGHKAGTAARTGGEGNGNSKVFHGHIVDVVRRRIYDGRIEVCDGQLFTSLEYARCDDVSYPWNEIP